MNDNDRYYSHKVERVWSKKTSSLNDAEFKVFCGEEFICLLGTYQEPNKELHMMTVYYDKHTFQGFYEEIDFFLHTITNSSFRTLWTVLKEGGSFVDMNQLGFEHDHLNRVQ